ncbi:MAG: transcriptional repressor LexA [Anaerolineae bacterium]|nr:transcriptional repressor LexA [Anaerolineae bacterium]
MSPEALTPSQEEFWKKLLRYVRKHGYAPTYEEMVTEFGLKTKSHAVHYVRQLERKGYIRRKANSPRALEIAPRPFSVPFCGKASAGKGINFTDIVGTVDVPPDLFVPADNLYAVQVDGNSLEDALIRSGDLLLVLAADRVENGQLAVVRVPSEDFPEGEWLCKRFFQRNSLVELRSENPRYPPRFVPARDVQVQGRGVGVIRTEFWNAEAVAQ